MSSHPLTAGTKLHEVWYNNGESGYSTAWRQVEDIEVVDVPGHMSCLPFAKVTLADKRGTILLPLHSMQEIVLDGP